jgi:hypothetical protein
MERARRAQRGGLVAFLASVAVSQREVGEVSSTSFGVVVVSYGAALGVLFVGDTGEPFAADHRDEMLEIAVRRMEDL